MAATATRRRSTSHAAAAPTPSRSPVSTAPFPRDVLLDTLHDHVKSAQRHIEQQLLRADDPVVILTAALGYAVNVIDGLSLAVEQLKQRVAALESETDE